MEVMGQFNKTVKILEGARNKLIDMRDNWFPVGSSYSMELDEFVMDKIDDILEEIEESQKNDEWTDSIGQPI